MTLLAPTERTPDHQKLAKSIDDRNSQELVIALVGPVGSGVSTSAKLLRDILGTEFGYDVPPPFKQSDIIKREAFRVGAGTISSKPLSSYVKEMQDAGNKLREKFGPDYLAQKTIEHIVTYRRSRGGIKNSNAVPGRRAYIIDSIKNIEELSLLRKVYRETLCLVGVFAPDEIRVQRLTNEGAIKDEVDKMIHRDMGEAGTFGQMTRKVFSFADFFVCNDQKPEELNRKLRRYLDIIFDVGLHTPTNEEAAMSKAAMSEARSACMSRQVGASIVSSSGELIATGWNDVPKFNGGLYTEDDQSVWDGDNKAIKDKDNRCFKWGGCFCHNEHHRNKIMDGIVSRIAKSDVVKRRTPASEIRKALEGTDIEDLTEYSRSIHAEMEAILSVAREGKHSLVGATLYSTTYPCHNCARHIVAAGIKDVIYIHPYRKSKAITLHNDAISENPLDRDNRVLFKQYDGVSPQIFLKCFVANRERKQKGGEILKISPKDAVPIFKIPLDAQLDYEQKVIADLADKEQDFLGT